MKILFVPRIPVTALCLWCVGLCFSFCAQAGVLTTQDGDLSQQVVEQLEFESATRAAFARGEYGAVVRSVQRIPAGLVLSPGMRALSSAALSLSEANVADDFQSLATAPTELGGNDAKLIVDALLAGDKPEAARSVAERTLMANPDDLGLLETLGRLRAEDGQHLIAVRYFEESLKLRTAAKLPVESPLLDQTARSYLALKRYAEAAALYNNYPEVGGELAQLATLHSLLDAGSVDAAIGMLDAASMPSSSAALFRARFLLLAGLPERSLDALKSAELVQVQSPARIKMQIVAALAAGDVAKGGFYLERLQDISKGEAIAPGLYALVYVAQGKIAAAQEKLAMSPAPVGEMAQQPSFGSALSRPDEVPQLALAYFRHQLGFFALASTDLAALSGSPVHSPLANLLMADSAYRSGDWTTALDSYTVLRQQLPEAVSLRVAMANVLNESGQQKAAQEMLADVVEQRPDFIAAQLARVALLLELELTDEAIEAIMWSLNFKPESGLLHEALVAAYIRRGDVDGARSALARLQTIARGESAAIWRLDGKLALLEGDAERARDLLEKALQAQFDRPEVMRDLADVYDEQARARLGSGLRALASMLEDPKRAQTVDAI